jgi:hypothetical protein
LWWLVVDNGNPDLQAVISGLKTGNMRHLALAGLAPSGGSPRGAPPPADPLVGQFRACIAQLNGLAQALERQGDQPRMVDVQEISLKLQRLSMDRQNAIAKAGVSDAGVEEPNGALNAAFPNINGGGTV